MKATILNLKVKGIGMIFNVAVSNNHSSSENTWSEDSDLESMAIERKRSEIH